MIKKKRKIVLFGLGALLVLFLVIGASYAIWQIVLQQTNENVVTTGCFKINFTEKNDINLNNAYPIVDEAGRQLTPYEFTIENTCESEASYQVNLEILDATTLMNHEYIKVMYGENVPKILTKYNEVQKTLNNAAKSYELETGVLGSKETKIFTLRLWMDYDTPPTEAAMNKIFKSKVTITSAFMENPKNNMMVAINNGYDPTEGANHNLTYSPNGEVISNLTFESTINPYENATKTVDFSELKNGSVLGYYVKNIDEDSYNLYIQANGKIKVNPEGAYYFYGYTPMKINGLENLDTSLVTDMRSMFWNVSNESLDLSTFDTTNVTNMDFMFNDCQISSLDLSNFNTASVISMAGMFRNCSSLTSLDLSSFNTRNVTNMQDMFSYCIGLISLDLSSFDTTNVIKYGRNEYGGGMFDGCTNLTKITYGNNFVYKAGALTTDMFLNCPANKPTHESWSGVTF